MAFNVDEFRAAFASKNSDGLTASPAYFSCEIPDLPPCLQYPDLKEKTRASINKMHKNMKFRASSADLPSRQLVSVQRAFNGPHKLVPYSTIYASCIIEFIETSSFDVRTFFDAWQDLIEGNQRHFSSEYYDNLIAPTFVVTAYNKSGKPEQRWTFYNVFPVSVNPSQLNWSNQSGILSVAVELSYHRWKFETAPFASSGSSSSSGTGNSLMPTNLNLNELGNMAQSYAKSYAGNYIKNKIKSKF